MFNRKKGNFNIFNNIKIIFFLFFLTIFSSNSLAEKKLPVPRFVTIKFNEVNARTGPERDCPIEWVFIKKGEPVEVIAEYDQWRKIRDIKGEGGWVHSSVISGNRSIIIINKKYTSLLKKPGKYNNIIAKLAPNLRCTFHKCQGQWCQVSCKKYKGWLKRKHIWGIYPEEDN